MIDYLKILVKNPNLNLLISNNQLDFKRDVSVSTGEDSTKSIAHYHHCKIVIHDSGTVLFSGSIHKMYNSITGVFAPNYDEVKDYKGFNGNQFYYHEINFVCQHLKALFGVSIVNLIIQNIEFGLNLKTSFNPQIFIKGLLPFEMKPFEYRFNEHFAQSVHNQYILKIYNKGKQYNLPMNTLRFELKVIKMEHQKMEVGINSLADISPLLLNKAFKYLEKQLKKVLYYDSTIYHSDMTKKQQIRLKDYSNPRYWQKLTSKERLRNKRRLNQIITETSQNLRKQLLETFDRNWVEFDHLSLNLRRVQFDSSNIVSDSTLLPQRICPITGLNLKHEKKGSKYAKTTTLKHLKKTDSKKYAEVCSLLLSNTKGVLPKFESNIMSHLAKQIRNRVYNQTKIKQLGYNAKIYDSIIQFNLFS